MQTFDEPTASFQVAQHGLGQQPNRFAFLAPLQLLLGSGQMLQAIPEPEQGRFAIAHSPLAFGIVASDDESYKARGMPIEVHCGRIDASVVFA